MKRTPKMQAARDALLSHYLRRQEERFRRKSSDKRKAANAALAKRYDDLRAMLYETKNYQPLSCVCKIDRVVITTNAVPWLDIIKIPGYRSELKPKRLWNRDYLLSTRIRGTGSIEEVVINHEPTVSWLAPYRITIIPKDTTGLQADDLRTILELLPGASIDLVEVAWDFPVDSVVDLDFVYRHAQFGNTFIGRGPNPFHGRWGNPNSKVVRAYLKWDIFQFRIELELHRGFLRANHINDLYDFRELPDVLTPQHLAFYKINRNKVISVLQRKGLPSVRIWKKLREKWRISLRVALRFMTKKLGLTNIRRLLIFMDEPNWVIREAIEELADQWPTRPPKLKGTL